MTDDEQTMYDYTPDWRGGYDQARIDTLRLVWIAAACGEALAGRFSRTVASVSEIDAWLGVRMSMQEIARATAETLRAHGVDVP